MMMYLLSASVLQDQLEGTFDRMLASDVKPEYILVSNITEGLVWILLSLIINNGYAHWFLSAEFTFGTAIMFAFLNFFSAVNGLAVGILISIISRSMRESSMGTVFALFGAIMLSGKKSSRTINLSLCFFLFKVSCGQLKDCQIF